MNRVLVVSRSISESVFIIGLNSESVLIVSRS